MPGKNGSALVQYVESAVSRSIGSMTGKEFRVTLDTSASSTSPVSEPILWQQAFSSVEEPSFWLQAGKDLWEAMGHVTLEAAGISEVSDEDCRSTWQEILNQTASAIASSMSAEQGREITVSQGAQIETPPSALQWQAFSVNDDAGNSWRFRTAWTPELESAGVALPDVARTPKSRDTSVSKTFDLLLEVALPVAVSFGRTSLPIKEVLKLNTGSIVELDRFITDPVDVIVNNCVIARGEVVVVDGNYGVRISHLASREERLRSGMAEAGHKGGRP